MKGIEISAETLCIMLGVAVVCCLFALTVWAMWFFHEWRKLENILDNFWREDYEGMIEEEVKETRESRLISQMRQILGRSLRQEKQAKEEKKQTMELLSDLSHQLKTPLANIVLDTELLESAKLEEEQRKEFLCHARVQANRMQWLIKSLLKASRLENGMIEFEADYSGIKQTLAKAVGAVYAQAAEKDIEIKVQEFEDISLYHNPKWTAEAIANLLENAVKYCEKGKVIEIGIIKMDIYCCITIKDYGMGIPESEYNNIFQRFYRGKWAESEEGTGLGLYLAQLILQSEKGYITVSSKLGWGSEFRVFLLNKLV